MADELIAVRWADAPFDDTVRNVLVIPVDMGRGFTWWDQNRTAWILSVSYLSTPVGRPDAGELGEGAISAWADHVASRQLDDLPELIESAKQHVADGRYEEAVTGLRTVLLALADARSVSVAPDSHPPIQQLQETLHPLVEQMRSPAVTAWIEERLVSTLAAADRPLWLDELGLPVELVDDLVRRHPAVKAVRTGAGVMVEYTVPVRELLEQTAADLDRAVPGTKGLTARLVVVESLLDDAEQALGPRAESGLADAEYAAAFEELMRQRRWWWELVLLLDASVVDQRADEHVKAPARRLRALLEAARNDGLGPREASVLLDELAALAARLGLPDSSRLHARLGDLAEQVPALLTRLMELAGGQHLSGDPGIVATGLFESLAAMADQLRAEQAERLRAVLDRWGSGPPSTELLVDVAEAIPATGDVPAHAIPARLAVQHLMRRAETTSADRSEQARERARELLQQARARLDEVRNLLAKRAVRGVAGDARRARPDRGTRQPRHLRDRAGPRGRSARGA